MRITAVDDKKDLFLLEDVLDSKLIEQFNREDINTYKWQKQEWQENIHRRVLIDHPTSVLRKIKEQLKLVPQQINETLNTTFSRLAVYCWQDFEGFKFGKHIDNSNVDTVMQIYIGNASTELGTVFYKCKEEDVENIDNQQQWSLINHDLPVRYNFKYIPNTGYLMFNNRTQAHGVTGTVQSTDKRVSCYCWIN